MNQTYGFVSAGANQAFSALSLLKNDGAKRYNKSAIQNLKLCFDTLIDQIGGQTVFFKFSNNAGLTDIKKLGHISGGAALSLGSLEHLFFQSCQNVCQVVDTSFLWVCLTPLI